MRVNSLSLHGSKAMNGDTNYYISYHYNAPKSEDFASGYIAAGGTLGWWLEPVPFGQISVFSVQAVAGRPTDSRVEVTRVFHITKPYGSIQVNVEITNTGQNPCFYLISWARMFP
jgi:hypothetical protein